MLLEVRIFSIIRFPWKKQNSNAKSNKKVPITWDGMIEKVQKDHGWEHINASNSKKRKDGRGFDERRVRDGCESALTSLFIPYDYVFQANLLVHSLSFRR